MGNEKQEKQPSHAQHDKAAWQFDAEEQAGRIEAFERELARLEAESAERFASTVDDFARLTKESLTYGTRLSSELRRSVFEAYRRPFAFGRMV